MGGDVLDYEGNASSPAASLLEAKLLINSTISDSNVGARFMSADLKDFSYNHFWKNQNTSEFMGSISYLTSDRNII